MKVLIGFLMVLGGIALGLYLGIWWAFIGGIVQVIEQVRADEISALAIACGIARVVFAGFIGWGSALLLIVPGSAFIKS